MPVGMMMTPTSCLRKIEHGQTVAATLSSSSSLRWCWKAVCGCVSLS